MNSGPKILLSTVFRRHNDDYYDWFESNAHTQYRLSIVRHISPGLRFIKENIPEVEILEYPSWEEYVARLKEGWDVVGYSFYQNEIHETLRMAEEARKQGIKELWAGNYGALTEGLESQFDRIFVGYAEQQIADLLGKRLEKLAHPPLFFALYLNPMSRVLGLRYKITGILFTQRGCAHRCNFCQTPAFCPKPSRIPLESIELVLKKLLAIGIREVIILDESFGTLRDHTVEVVELLKRYGFYWSAMIRADELLKNLEEWSEHRMVTGLIGIESLSQATLASTGKKESIETIERAIEKMQRHNLFNIGYYMIGYEDDTVSSIPRDLEELAKLKVDFNQLCVVTPYPRTPLWHEIESKYGIFEKDWRKWDAKHLVWHHPHISPEQMERLFQWGIHRLNQPLAYFRTLTRWLGRYIEGEPDPLSCLRYLVYLPSHAMRFDERDRNQSLVQQSPVHTSLSNP